MSRIIVTGATGYIGAHVVALLMKEGYEVYTVSRPTSSFDLVKRIAPCFEAYKSFRYRGEVEDLIRFFDEVKPDVVIHIAALYIAEHKPRDIHNLIMSNVGFSTEILEATARSGCKMFINTSTSWQHYDKEGRVPACLYAATKASVERIIDYYVDAYNMRGISLTIFDSYGPNDPRKKIVNILRDLVKNGGTIKMSAGEQKMSLVYIDDLANAYLTAIHHMEKVDKKQNQVFYLRAKKQYSLKEIARCFEEITNRKLDIIWGGREYRSREVMAPYMGGKLLPGWEPQISIKEGLAKLLYSEN